LHIDVKVLPKINKERKCLFVSIDRATRLVYIEIRDKKDAKNGAKFRKCDKVLSFCKLRKTNGTKSAILILQIKQ
jgi:hypothetical protein